MNVKTTPTRLTPDVGLRWDIGDIVQDLRRLRDRSLEARNRKARPPKPPLSVLKSPNSIVA
jgi:hypothetical protein